MFSDDYNTVSSAAKIKTEFLRKKPIGYFFASMLAGFYVGLGIMLIYTIGGQLNGLPYVKTVMGVSFGIALSLVTIAGAELFTGNNLVMTAGLLKKTIGISEAIKLLIICYIGNWLGSVLIAVIYYGTGLTGGATGEFIASSSAIKMSIPFFPLLLRGLLCNILVCLATWCGYRCKSESGKLIMVFWCLFAFITSGYEHSIANMSLLTVSLLTPSSAAVGIGGYFYNILTVTLGNMLGGILFLALPYFVISNQKE